MTLPDTGESTMSAPFSRTFSASARLAAGLTVLMSMSDLARAESGDASRPDRRRPTSSAAESVTMHEDDVGGFGDAARRVRPLHAFIEQPLALDFVRLCR